MSSVLKESLILRVDSRVSSEIPAGGPAAQVARRFGLIGKPGTGKLPRASDPASSPANNACEHGIQASQTLYEDFELTIRPGEITAVVGPSGAGKSVLLDLAARQVPHAIWLGAAKFARSKLPPVAILTGDLSRRLAMLSRCGLADAHALVTPARKLSGGQLYRLAMAQAMQRALARPHGAVIVADEFAACLDDVTAANLCRQLRTLISGAKVSLLVATPRLEVAEFLRADQVVAKPLGEKPVVVSGSSADDQRWGRATPLSLEGRGRRAAAGEGDGMGEKPAPAHDPTTWPVERGTLADYHELAHFHYIAGAPAAHKRVYVIRPTALSHQGRGANNIAQLLQPRVAAVLVISPPLRCVRARNRATAGRYAGRDIAASLALLNAEVESISRVIVHPMYRGLGLAVKLVRYALAHAQRPWMEALAVMGHVNPFFEHAGMTPCASDEPQAAGKRRKRNTSAMDYVYYLARTGLEVKSISAQEAGSPFCVT